MNVAFRLIFFVLAFSLVATAVPRVGTAEPAKVKLDALRGTMSFPLTVLKEKIAKKHNLEVEIQLNPGPQALFTKMKTGEFQVTFGAFLSNLVYRARGVKVTQIYSMAALKAHGPVVPKDSPIRDYGDLKGKKIGFFGGPTSTAAFMVRVIAKKFYGFDPFKISKPQFGAPPLLWGVLEKGDLDAITTLEPFITRMLETGKFRALPAVGTLWKQKTGQDVLGVTVIGQDDWLEKNPETAKRFLRAFKESIEYVQAHREVWPEIAKRVGVKTEWGRNTIYDRVAHIFLTRWDPDYLAENVKWAEIARETLGGKLRGLPEKIPKDAWTFKYVP